MNNEESVEAFFTVSSLESHDWNEIGEVPITATHAIRYVELRCWSLVLLLFHDRKLARGDKGSVSQTIPAR